MVSEIFDYEPYLSIRTLIQKWKQVERNCRFRYENRAAIPKAGNYKMKKSRKIRPYGLSIACIMGIRMQFRTEDTEGRHTHRKTHVQ